MLGGPFMNLLIAFVLMAIVCVGIGLPAVTTTVGSVNAFCPPLGRGGAPLTPTSLAAAAGLRPGDRIVAFDGEDVTSRTSPAGAAGQATPVVFVQRDGEQVDLTITPVEVERQVVADARRRRRRRARRSPPGSGSRRPSSARPAGIGVAAEATCSR